MAPDNAYIDRKGHVYGLATLAADELDLVRRLQAHAESHSDWFDYHNYWMPELIKFGDSRGITAGRSRVHIHHPHDGRAHRQS